MTSIEPRLPASPTALAGAAPQFAEPPSSPADRPAPPTARFAALLTRRDAASGESGVMPPGDGKARSDAGKPPPDDDGARANDGPIVAPSPTPIAALSMIVSPIAASIGPFAATPTATPAAPPATTSSPASSGQRDVATRPDLANSAKPAQLAPAGSSRGSTDAQMRPFARAAPTPTDGANAAAVAPALPSPATAPSPPVTSHSVPAVSIDSLDPAANTVRPPDRTLPIGRSRTAAKPGATAHSPLARTEAMREPSVGGDLRSTIGAREPASLGEPQPQAQSPAQTVTSASAQTGTHAAHDLDAIVDRLVEARQAGALINAGAVFAHSEFGHVRLRVSERDGAVAIALSSPDPSFAPVAAGAIQVSSASDASRPTTQMPGDAATDASSPQSGNAADGQVAADARGHRRSPSGDGAPFDRATPIAKTRASTAKRSGGIYA